AAVERRDRSALGGAPVAFAVGKKHNALCGIEQIDVQPARPPALIPFDGVACAEGLIAADADDHPIRHSPRDATVLEPGSAHRRPHHLARLHLLAASTRCSRYSRSGATL